MTDTGGARQASQYTQGNRGWAARHVLDIIPESAGPRKAIMRGSVIHSIRAPGSQSFLAKEHAAGIVLAPARKLRASLGSDRIIEYDAPVGCLVLNPAGVDSSLSWSTTRENAVVSISPQALSDLAAHELDHDDVELQPPAFGTVDVWALSIAQRIAAELTAEAAANELFLDSLVTVFGVHLLRTYSNRRRQPPALKGGLSPAGARRVQEYLNEHFMRKISVGELASVAGVSPNHFIVSFGRTFGMPPHRYLINLRLAFAERLLLDGRIAIAEIAHLAGFSDQGHLATTMKKFKGTTPSQLRFGKER